MLHNYHNMPLYVGLNSEELYEKELQAIDKFYSNLLPANIETMSKNTREEYVARLVFAVTDIVEKNEFYITKLDERYVMFCDKKLYEVDVETASISGLEFNGEYSLENRKLTLSSFISIHKILLQDDNKQKIECYFIDRESMPNLDELNTENNELNLLFRLGEFQKINGDAKVDLLASNTHIQCVIVDVIKKLNEQKVMSTEIEKELHELMTHCKNTTINTVKYLNTYIENEVVNSFVKVAYGK